MCWHIYWGCRFLWRGCWTPSSNQITKWKVCCYLSIHKGPNKGAAREFPYGAVVRTIAFKSEGRKFEPVSSSYLGNCLSERKFLGSQQYLPPPPAVSLVKFRGAILRVTSSETRSGFASAKFEYSLLIGQCRSLGWSRDTFLMKLRLYTIGASFQYGHRQYVTTHDKVACDQSILRLMSHCLTTIEVEPGQCPSHQSILLIQWPICEIFTIFF